MKLKRNDSCHCGSGKKYKNCHMREDQAAKPAIQDPVLTQKEEAAASPTSTFDSKYSDANQKHSDEPWADVYSRFAQADYEGKKAVLQSAIMNDELDGETIFEFFNELYPQMMGKGDEREFLELAALTKSHQPDAYLDESHWFWDWNVVAAIKIDDTEALQAITDELIEDGSAELEQFLYSFSCLLYHGKRKTLANAIEKFDPEADADDYFEETEDVLQDALGNLLLLNYIEIHEAGSLLDEENVDQICGQVARYTENLEREEVVDFISRAGGLVISTWAIDDFELDPSKHIEDEWDEEDEEEDPALEHFDALGAEFIHYAHQVENIPRTKVYLAQKYLAEYFIGLQMEEMLDEDAYNRIGRSRRSAKERKQTRDINRLLPNAETTEAYLQRFYGLMANGVYQGMAFFTLLPTWVRFIEFKGLVDQEECQKSLRELAPLHHTMEQAMGKNPDTALAADLGQWWRDDKMAG